MRYKVTKCEIEMLNDELIEAYTKVKFLELEVVQTNAKVERVSTKGLMMSSLIKNPPPTKPD